MFGRSVYIDRETNEEIIEAVNGHLIVVYRNYQGREDVRDAWDSVVLCNPAPIPRNTDLTFVSKKINDYTNVRYTYKMAHYELCSTMLVPQSRQHQWQTIHQRASR